MVTAQENYLMGLFKLMYLPHHSCGIRASVDNISQQYDAVTGYKGYEFQQLLKVLGISVDVADCPN
jgi:hypothetical protein